MLATLKPLQWKPNRFFCYFNNPGFGIGEICLFLIFLLINIIVIVQAFTAKDWYNAGGATAFLTVFGLIIMFVPIFKSGGILLPLLNISWERGIKYHRWLAVYTCGTFIVHGGCFVIYWQQTGMIRPNIPIGNGVKETNTIEQMLTIPKTGLSTTSQQAIANGDTSFAPPQNFYGFLATVVMFFMCLQSLNYFRRRYFELWQKIHWASYPILTAFCYYHFSGSSLAAILAIAVAYYFLTTVLSYAYGRKVKIVKATLFPGDVICLHWNREGWEFEAGQYVFVDLPAHLSRELKPWWIFQSSHPFSISSAPHEDTVSVHIKVSGKFTQHLKKLVLEKKLEGESIIVRGPFGSLSVDIKDPKTKRLQNNVTVVLVAGGIGVTPMMSISKSLIHQLCDQVTGDRTARSNHIGGNQTTSDPNCCNKLQNNGVTPLANGNMEMSTLENGNSSDSTNFKVHLIWSMKEHSHYKWFEADVQKMIATAVLKPNTVNFKVFNHISKPKSSPASATPVTATFTVADVEENLSSISTNVDDGNHPMIPSESPNNANAVSFILSRPDIEKYLGDLCEENNSNGSSKIFVLSCGPKQLQQNCNNACANLNNKINNQLFQHHSEIFEI